MGCLSHLSFMPKIDLTNYEGGREQAFVKHYLLKKYLSRWGYKIGSSWDLLVFVDGFAGPWGTKDEEFADASFGIAINALNAAIDGLFKERQRSIRGACIFVEKAPKPFAKLNAFAKSHSTDRVRAVALKGRFSKNIPAIDRYVETLGANPFKFVFLDQKGWAATPMKELKPFVRRRPCELLFNLMTSFLTRFVDRKDLTSTYDALYGRQGVVERIRSLPKGTGRREELAVEEYCKSLRDICKFQYVSQAVIMHPQKESVLYYLVFATNSLHGIEVFKNAEKEAADIQNDVRFETHLRKTGLPTFPGLFDDAAPKSRLALTLTKHYSDLARQKIVGILLADSPADGISYQELFGKAMAFPLVFPDDLISWLEALTPHIRIEFAKSPRRRKSQHPRKPDPFEDDRVFVVNPAAIARWETKC
jgi:three-Cys-motif partner protein